MKPLLGFLLLSLAFGSTGPEARASERKVQVSASRVGGVTMLRVDVRAASVREIVKAIEPHLGERVIVRTDRNPVLDFRSPGIEPMAALELVVTRAGLVLAQENDLWVASDPSEPTLTIDIKDGEVRDIMREVKSQCGIRNLIVDPDVQGRGTFLFNDLPCSQAIRTILATMGLDYEIDSAVMRVAADR
jgi:hypothetical protein